MKWDGAVTFADYWLGYIGQADQTAAHAHVAIQLCIGLHQDISVAFGSRILTAPGVLIGPLSTIARCPTQAAWPFSIATQTRHLAVP